jgi:hypothetical protein
VPRRPAKQIPVAEWQISRVAKKAVYLGKVEAADAETATRTAINKFDIEPEHQGRRMRAFLGIFLFLAIAIVIVATLIYF